MDKAFPGFTIAFDNEAMLSLFQKEHPALQVKSCNIHGLRYMPGQNCIILYRMALDSSETSGEQFFAAKILRKDESPQKMSPAPFFYLREPHIALYPFPHDPVMHWLPAAWNEKIMTTQLQQHPIVSQHKPLKVTIKLLDYTPQMRATFLYHVLMENVQTQKRAWHHWIGKTNAFKQADAIFANSSALWKACQKKFSIPKFLGFIQHPRLTFQEQIEGKPLGSLVNSESFDLIISETAKAIANFHRTSFPLTKTRSFGKEARSLNRWSDVLISICPDLGERIEALKTQILSEMEKRIFSQSPIHADFHHSNVLVHGTQIRLIDFDEMAYGDPCVDVGRFLSSLRIPSLRKFGTIQALERQREKFLDIYLQIFPLKPQNIRLFESASLFTSSASSFCQQHPNWKHEVSILIEEAEKVFERAMSR